jgi:hypothetical protein
VRGKQHLPNRAAGDRQSSAAHHLTPYPSLYNHLQITIIRRPKPSIHGSFRVPRDGNVTQAAYAVRAATRSMAKVASSAARSAKNEVRGTEVTGPYHGSTLSETIVFGSLVSKRIW